MRAQRILVHVVQIGLIAVLVTAPAWGGQQAPKPELPADPGAFVRTTIENELKPDPNHTRYEYRLVKKKPNRNETFEMIEAKEGTVGRLLLINDQPLTAEQRAKEDKRLQRLVNDPSALAQKIKSQKEDDARTRAMLRAMPDAFLYQYAGTKNEEPWGEVVELTFKPNPNFDPPTRETLVYRGMEGSMWIALPARRLARIQAKLFRDVDFGWGILGHLDQGGQFVVEQKPVNGDHWEPSHMVLNFTGKALIFKTIRINDDQTTSDYRPVSPDMTVAQAVEALKKQDGQVAENHSSSK
jgi:hypothetical protein